MTQLKHKLLTLSMVLFVLIGQKATAQTGPLTLKDALNYALKYSETVKKARLDIEAGKAKTTEARSQALPQITGSGSISDNLIIQKTPLPGEILGRPGEYVLVAFSQKYNTSAQVQLSQQLFNQSVFTGLKAAKAGEEYYNLATGLSEENILQQVAAAYYQLLVTREKMAVLDSNINTLEKSQKIITNQFSNGLARKIDVDRIKVSLTNSQIQRLELSNALTQQENLLKFYMGMPIETKLDIPQTELNKIATSASALAEELNIENLKEYQLLRKQEQLLGYQRDARKAEYIPKLSFNTNFLYTGFGNKFDMFKNDGSTLWAKASAITVNLSVPIFDGFARRSRVKQAEIDVLKAREDIRNTTQSLKMANDNARRQIENSVKTINEQKENMRLAQEVYTSTQNNYNNGLATLTDLLDAENSLVTAQNSYTQALLNYKLAEIQLLKSNGNIKSLLN